MRILHCQGNEFERLVQSFQVHECVICSPVSLSVPDDNHQIAFGCHIFISRLHATRIIGGGNDVYNVCIFYYPLIASFVAFIPLEVLIGARDSNFKADIWVVFFELYNDFRKVLICANRSARDKIVKPLLFYELGYYSFKTI